MMLENFCRSPNLQGTLLLLSFLGDNQQIDLNYPQWPNEYFLLDASHEIFTNAACDRHDWIY
jgi:hypothetical protein